jgi:ABC-type amino acid transport substrate-binding protein
MHHHSKYLLGAASAALCFAVVLAVPATIAGPQPDARVAPGMFDTGMFDTVNRASKGDRLRVIVRPPEAAPFEVQAPGGSSPKSLDGCESAFGQMDHSSAATLAQRCTT